MAGILPQSRQTCSQTWSEDRILELADGRTLGFRDFGDPRGRPVIALHGTPGSRFKYAGSQQAALSAGLRLISVDRWGYGLSSSFHAAPSLPLFGTDVATLADRLGLDRFAVTGVSGGGPFAVAAAAALGKRVTALALIAPVGPIAGPGSHAKLSPFHTLCFRVLPHVPGAIGGVFQVYRAGLSAAPNTALWLALSRSAAVDRLAVRDPETRQRLIETFATGLERGVEGPRIDMGLFSRPWGIDFSAVSAPVRIWLGEADRNVPGHAVRKLAGLLPGSELTVLPDAGHLWVARNSHDVMDWIAGKMQST